MIQFIILIIQKNPKIYGFLKRQIRIENFIRRFSVFLGLIQRKYYSLAWSFLINPLSYYMFGIHKDIVVSIKGFSIIMPNHMKPIDGCIEVFIEGFYSSLSGYNNILDLGGYIGESGLFLSKINKKVTIFEAHPENYQYIIKNAKNTNNIAFFNKAIVGDETKELSIQGQAFHMSFSPENKNKISKEYVIPTENFFALLKSQKYDGLKMDIEGGEYNCLYPLIDKNIGLEGITGGFIEFHPLKNMDKIKQTKEIITHLQKYYSIDLCDSVSNKVIFLEDIGSYDVIYIAFKNHS